MLPDRVSNPGPLTYESGVLPIALRGPAITTCNMKEPQQKYPHEAMGITLLWWGILTG